MCVCDRKKKTWLCSSFSKVIHNLTVFFYSGKLSSWPLTYAVDWFKINAQFTKCQTIPYWSTLCCFYLKMTTKKWSDNKSDPITTDTHLKQKKSSHKNRRAYLALGPEIDALLLEQLLTVLLAHTVRKGLLEARQLDAADWAPIKLWFLH